MVSVFDIFCFYVIFIFSLYHWTSVQIDYDSQIASGQSQPASLLFRSSTSQIIRYRAVRIPNTMTHDDNRNVAQPFGGTQQSGQHFGCKSYAGRKLSCEFLWRSKKIRKVGHVLVCVCWCCVHRLTSKQFDERKVSQSADTGEYAILCQMLFVITVCVDIGWSCITQSSQI